jgi:hypothetical protein
MRRGTVTQGQTRFGAYKQIRLHADHRHGSFETTQPQEDNMKFRWVKDPNDPGETNLLDLDRKSRNVVGWVCTSIAARGKYEVRLVWVDHDDQEDVLHNTKREAMRALRTAYRMHIIGGGALRPRGHEQGTTATS